MAPQRAVWKSMRVAIYVALLVACIAAAPEMTRASLASAAAVVFETLPYAALASILSPLLGRFAPAVIAYAGCGCSSGPGARSIPATVACAAVFGPYIAAARWIVAIVVAALRHNNRPHEHVHEPVPLLHDLAQLAPPALLSGVLSVTAPALSLAHRSPLLQFVAGAVLGFAAAPCALGGVALASALRAQSAIASAVMLCVVGIIDLRVWWSPHVSHARRDRITYATIALACGIVAYEHGAGLVHPHMTWPLWGCAMICAYLALRSTVVPFAAQRAVAVLLVAVTLAGSPPPPYVATEATLDTLYPGERLDFTGEYLERAGRPRVVRYAITCCRADARPVSVELSRPVHDPPGHWMNVHGLVRRSGGALVLDASRVTEIAPPADPFVYL